MADRNERARQQFAESRARKQAERAAADLLQQAGGPVVLDRLGNRLVVGGAVLMHMPIDPVGIVQALTPVVDPRLPPGMIAVSFLIQQTLTVQVGVLQQGLVQLQVPVAGAGAGVGAGQADGPQPITVEEAAQVAGNGNREQDATEPQLAEPAESVPDDSVPDDIVTAVTDAADAITDTEDLPSRLARDAAERQAVRERLAAGVSAGSPAEGNSDRDADADKG